MWERQRLMVPRPRNERRPCINDLNPDQPAASDPPPANEAIATSHVRANFFGRSHHDKCDRDPVCAVDDRAVIETRRHRAALNRDAPQAQVLRP